MSTKNVSALLDGAKMGRLSKMILGLDGQISANLSKKMIGGQWISGQALIKTTGFEFQPSKLNQPFFKNMDELRILIPWSELNQVSKRFGMVASIIDLETSADTLSIRCYGGDELISQINAARTA
ncbi:MAG: hypothetical protein HRT82_00865 [Henriciella sp.]|nr:hypothetical protein [Henriciella sp.]